MTFSTAVTVANEIVKAVDFTFAHDQAIGNIAVAMQGVLANPTLDLVIGGVVSPYGGVGGMNVRIDSVYAHSGSSGIDVVDTEVHQPVSIEAADATQDRIDIIQIRGVEEQYDAQNRKFRDPSSGSETTQEINTKKRIKLEIIVKKGTNGSVIAPQADTDFVKLTEIDVPAGTVKITADNIKNITARYAGANNGGWTEDINRTFNPGYLTDIVGKFLVEHTDTGTHKANVIKFPMIKFGNESGDVNGGVIPTGLSMDIVGQNFPALSNIAQVMAALATAVNLAYPYANNILAKYMLIAAEPVAASTANINVVTGGIQTIDGVACSVGQMVFLKDQTNPKENGFWEVQTGAWNRYAGFTTATPDAFDNKFIYVKAGTANRGKVFFMEQESDIGADTLVFQESIFSPIDLPGKVLIRDMSGRTIDDAKREQAIIDAKLDLTSHADMVEGRGRNLLEVFGVANIPQAMAEIRRRLNNNGEIDATGIPDFRGIRIGDYIDGIDFSSVAAPPGGSAAPQAWNDTYKNNRIVVSGFNIYKGYGDTENTKNHILFTFRHVIAKGQMKTSNDNAGGYPATVIRAWLEGAAGDGSGALAMALKQQLGGDYLYTIRLVHSVKGNYSYNSFTLFLPTELEVFGYKTYGDDSNQYNTNVQYPIYQRSGEYRIKRFNGDRWWWWEGDPWAAGATSFAHVDYGGGATCGGASHTEGGVAPAFCVA
ncbi:hypothetical protein AGMMS50268_24980 [Spirochaetia bacterium]|nr:hypothetical protein AGMMS50268_24980 [Spirochaetia bacterium]